MITPIFKCFPRQHAAHCQQEAHVSVVRLQQGNYVLSDRFRTKGVHGITENVTSFLKFSQYGVHASMQTFTRDPTLPHDLQLLHHPKL